MKQKESAAQAWQGLSGGRETKMCADKNVSADIIPRDTAESKGIGQSERAIG